MKPLGRTREQSKQQANRKPLNTIKTCTTSVKKNRKKSYWNIIKADDIKKLVARPFLHQSVDMSC